jgi:hypothetical protein
MWAEAACNLWHMAVRCQAGSHHFKISMQRWPVQIPPLRSGLVRSLPAGAVLTEGSGPGLAARSSGTWHTAQQHLLQHSASPSACARGSALHCQRRQQTGVCTGQHFEALLRLQHRGPARRRHVIYS